jgi:beta-RFAP synthase
MTPECEIEWTAPARIHCGLIALEQDADSRFGGCGVMCRGPRTRLRLSAASQWQLIGDDADRWLRLIKQWQLHFANFAGARWCEPIERWPLCLEILETPPRHVGLGSGTQAALLVATALCHWVGLDPPSVAELALAMGRARRSAIGTYGFRLGGFLVDRGLTPGEPLALLDFQTALPEPWRVVILQPQLPPGISGLAEINAFERQLPGDRHLAQQMRSILQGAIVPAAAQGNLMNFAEAIHEFNFLSGLHYAKVQAGAYHSVEVASIVTQIRAWGYPGVVQSSWGPTLAVFVGDALAARELQTKIQRDLTIPCQVQVTEVAGASGLAMPQPSRV